jgi:hypothetical protein
MATNNSKWISGNCGMNLRTPSWDASWVRPAQKAMDQWNGAGASFQFRSDKSASNHFASYDLGRWNGWLAMTYVRPAMPASSLAGANILVNLYQNWNPVHPNGGGSPQGNFDLETVLTHELGHCLELLDDPPGSSTIMSGAIAPGTRKALHANDIAEIKKLYP